MSLCKFAGASHTVEVRSFLLHEIEMEIEIWEWEKLDGDVVTCRRGIDGLHYITADVLWLVCLQPLQSQTHVPTCDA